MVDGGDRAGGLVDRYALSFGAAAELLGEETDLSKGEAALGGYRGARIIERWRTILARLLIDGIVLNHESVFASGHEFNQPGIDACEGIFREWFLAAEDALTFIAEVKDFAHGLPRRKIVKEIGGSAAFAVGRYGKCDRETMTGEDAEESLAGGIGAEVGGIEYAMVEVVTVAHDVDDPVEIAAALVA